MSRSIRGRGLLTGLLLLLVISLTAGAYAETYSNVYGQTLDRIRVRDDASMKADVIDNILPERCVYILSSKQSGSTVFVHVRYRNAEGETDTGWIAKSSGGSEYVEILTNAEAQSRFGVSGGSVPRTAAGTMSASERKARAEGKTSDTTTSTSSDTIRYVQDSLRTLGYYNGETTGNLGNKTKEAIREYQKKNGLTESGDADSATVRSIRSAMAKATPTPKPSSASADTIRYVQESLKTLGIYSGDVTGNLGSKTVAAIKAFQRKYDLEETGEPDSATVKAIRAEMTRVKATPTPARTSSTASSSTIRYVQESLKTLGYYNGEITGRAGEKTVAAIKAFQKKSGLKETGEANSTTVEAIRKAVASAKTTPRPTSSTASDANGYSSKTISEVQQLLKNLGYYTGSVTGNYGEKTKAAVEKFQKEHKLTANGKLSSSTIQAIRDASKKKTGSSSSSSSSSRKVYNLDWFKAKGNGIFGKIGLTKGKDCVLTDLTTGKRLNVRIQSAGSHLDVEPVTSNDTKTLCSIFGVSSPDKISARRRPAMITTAYGYRIVCSIYGQPHGHQDIHSNGYDGQFCLHFLHSKTSGTAVVDNNHQAAIRSAVSIVGSSSVVPLRSADDL